MLDSGRDVDHSATIGRWKKADLHVRAKEWRQKRQLIQVYNGQEKLLCHIAMVSKFLDLNKSKCQSKSEITLLQTLNMLNLALI